MSWTSVFSDQSLKMSLKKIFGNWTSTMEFSALHSSQVRINFWGKSMKFTATNPSKITLIRNLQRQCFEWLQRCFWSLSSQVSFEDLCLFWRVWRTEFYCGHAISLNRLFCFEHHLWRSMGKDWCSKTEFEDDIWRLLLLWNSRVETLSVQLWKDLFTTWRLFLVQLDNRSFIAWSTMTWHMLYSVRFINNNA